MIAKVLKIANCVEILKYMGAMEGKKERKIDGHEPKEEQGNLRNTTVSRRRLACVNFSDW